MSLHLCRCCFVFHKQIRGNHYIYHGDIIMVHNALIDNTILPICVYILPTWNIYYPYDPYSYQLTSQGKAMLYMSITYVNHIFNDHHNHHTTPSSPPHYPITHRLHHTTPSPPPPHYPITHCLHHTTPSSPPRRHHYPITTTCITITITHQHHQPTPLPLSQ